MSVLNEIQIGRNCFLDVKQQSLTRKYFVKTVGNLTF